MTMRHHKYFVLGKEDAARPGMAFGRPRDTFTNRDHYVEYRKGWEAMQAAISAEIDKRRAAEEAERDSE